MVEEDDIITGIISQVTMVTNSKNWIVESSATRHICANKDVFASYTPVGDDEKVLVYLGDTQLKIWENAKSCYLTSEKILALNGVLHVSNIRANLIYFSLLGKIEVKVSFKSNMIVMTKNNVNDIYLLHFR